MSSVFSVHQRTCLISHTSEYVGAIRRSVTGPLVGGYSARARNRFNQVVEAKRFEGVFLCRKMC